MQDQLVKVINKVGLVNILAVTVESDRGNVKRVRVLVKEGDDVLIAAAGRQCKFEPYNGEHHKHLLSVEIGDVVVYTYIK